MSIVSKYIKDGNIFIPEQDWKKLNEENESEVLRDILCDEVMQGNIKLPMRELDFGNARESFLNLVNYQTKPYKSGDIVTRYDYKYAFSGRYISESVVGNIASDYFQQENRFCASGQKFLSPQEGWKQRGFVRSILGSLWTMKHTNVTMHGLRSCIALRAYIASQFRPAVAKSVYDKFGSVDVLDFSSGWGDRLCGFYACENTKSYIGIDPNKKVYDNYYKQAEFYASLTHKKECTFYNSPAEDVTLDSEIVDTVFTSPPYFNAEKYTDDDSQSFKRYSEVDGWLDGFMYPTVDMCWKALKDGGYMIINISDVFTDNKLRKICDPMNDYIQSKGGVFVEALGMEMSRRPNSGALKDKEGVVVEPMWVFRKNISGKYGTNKAPDLTKRYARFSFFDDVDDDIVEEDYEEYYE